MTGIDLELLASFIEEAEDTLVQFERALLDLEYAPSAELHNSLFRAAHNLKGASRSVGLEAFGEFVHVMEDVIASIIRGAVPVTPDVVALLLRCHAALFDWNNGLRTRPDFIPAVSELSSSLVEIAECSPSVPPETSHEDTCPKSPPPREDDDLENLFRETQAAYLLESIESASPEDATAGPDGTSGLPSDSARDKVAQIPTLSSSTASEAQGVPATAKSSHHGPEETMRISAAKLDNLIQLIGELTIHQGIIAEGRRTKTLDSKTTQHAIHLSQKITKELHSRALSLRMQPVISLFQRVERAGRDVARMQHKKIRFELVGTDVELDKGILEKLADPLLHMVRNAVDHGMESTEERAALGKSIEGKITLAASQQASGVHISIKDDGRGLNRERILLKAIEKGLIAAGTTLSDRMVWNLIFEPGFSTAAEITEISGRGVGMDVVRSHVQALKGSIEVESTPGHGSEFSVVLPTTLSVLDALVIRLNSQRYAIPMQDLAEIIDLKNYEVESSNNLTKIISIRGMVIPVEDLGHYLPSGVDRDSSEATRNTLPALVVQTAGKMVAFQVEQVLTQQQVVVRPLADHMQCVPAFSGSTILGDGEPSIILSLPRLAEEFLTHVSGEFSYDHN